MSLKNTPFDSLKELRDKLTQEEAERKMNKNLTSDFKYRGIVSSYLKNLVRDNKNRIIKEIQESIISLSEDVLDENISIKTVKQIHKYYKKESINIYYDHNENL